MAVEDVEDVGARGGRHTPAAETRSWTPPSGVPHTVRQEHTGNRFTVSQEADGKEEDLTLVVVVAADDAEEADEIINLVNLQRLGGEIMQR